MPRANRKVADFMACTRFETLPLEVTPHTKRTLPEACGGLPAGTDTPVGTRAVALPRYDSLSDIKFPKARGRKPYCNTATTDNAGKFNI